MIRVPKLNLNLLYFCACTLFITFTDHKVLMKQKIRNFIFDELIFVAEPENFSDDDDLLEAGLDSMGIMRLIMFIEEQFGVTLPDSEIDPDNVNSFNALEAWVLHHKS